MLCFFTIDHVSHPVSPFIRFHHSRCDPALSVFASKCQSECYAWMAALCDLGDPCWGSLVSALSLVVSITLLPGPCVVLCFLCFASCSEVILNDTQDVIMQVIPIAGSDPTLCAFRLFWFVCCFVSFVCLVCLFLVVFFVWFLAGTARWTAYSSTTSTFVAIDKLIALHDNYNWSFCCEWTCVTTWRKPWTRWKEKILVGARYTDVQWKSYTAGEDVGLKFSQTATGSMARCALTFS